MITQKELKETFSYDKNTGIFTRLKVGGNGKNKIGNIAGTLHKQSGYIKLKINNVSYMAHRLVWLYVNGYMPNEQIDHINHIRNDNRILNLREANDLINSKNRSLRTDNKSGIVGVYYAKNNNRWNAQISIDKDITHLGSFITIEEAINARNIALLENKDYHKNHGSYTKGMNIPSI